MESVLKMEYLVMVLCLVILVLLVLLYRTAKENTIISEYKGARISALLSEVESVRRELRAALDRESNTQNELTRTKFDIGKLKHDLLKKQSIKGYTSEELKQNLRFLLPDSTIVAHNVRLKLDTETGSMIGVVRKKVQGKFADIEVEPILIPAESNASA